MKTEALWYLGERRIERRIERRSAELPEIEASEPGLTGGCIKGVIDFAA